MKRILLFSSEFPPGPGGIGTHAHQLAQYLANQGLTVAVLSPQDYASNGEIKAFNAQQAFAVHRLPSCDLKALQSLRRFQYVRQTFQKVNPDLVIASGRRAIWLSAVFQFWHKTPFVVIGHGKEFGATAGLKALITRTSGNRANAVICVSHYTKNALHHLGITKPPAVVIHNGADPTRFYRLPDKEVKAYRGDHGAADQFVLLTVGKVSDRKGQEVVIRALPKIKKSIPNVVYWIAGLPEKQKTLEALADELGVSENIQFWGRVTNDTLLNLYNACDLFLMTSRQLSDGDFEGYGIAVVEAALCRKTALVSDNSGLAEAVRDGETGLLVAQNDPEGTAQAVVRLAQDPATLKRLALNAHRSALENQTWARVGERYLLALEDIYCQSKNGRP